MKLGMVEDSLTKRRIRFQKPHLRAEVYVSPKPHRSQIVQREVQVCEKWRFTVASECLKVPSSKVDGCTGSDRKLGWPDFEFSH